MRANERVTLGKGGHSHLTMMDPTGRGGKKRGKERERREKKKEEREAPPSL